MSSAIDTTKPTSGNAFTADVRANFTIAKTEIEALQALVNQAVNTTSRPTFAGLTLAGDVVLERDAANTLAQRRGTNPQSFLLYNTFTDASNYERLNIGWTGSAAIISTTLAGAGVSRPLRLSSSAGGSLGIGEGASVWNITNLGHFVANPDNTFDIGASGTTRPRTGYFGTDLFAGRSLNVNRGSAVGGGPAISISNGATPSEI